MVVVRTCTCKFTTTVAGMPGTGTDCPDINAHELFTLYLMSGNEVGARSDVLTCHVDRWQWW